jgi:hypothetical protein
MAHPNDILRKVSAPLETVAKPATDALKGRPQSIDAQIEAATGGTSATVAPVAEVNTKPLDSATAVAVDAAREKTQVANAAAAAAAPNMVSEQVRAGTVHRAKLGTPEAAVLTGFGGQETTENGRAVVRFMATPAFAARPDYREAMQPFMQPAPTLEIVP